MDSNDTPTGQGGEPDLLKGTPIGKGKAHETDISLSQAILAPLDAIFKAQLHGARSFLNMLLQLGYRGMEGEESAVSKADGTPFTVKFDAEIKDAEKKKRIELAVPALALVPIQPIAIHNAEYELEMTAQQIFKHRQMQESRVKERPAEDERRRPWNLVRQPISIRGVLATPVDPLVKDEEEEADGTKARYRGSTIKVKVRVDKTAMPAGLSKLLTSLTEMSELSEKKETEDKEDT
jgi:hypothetical protein